ncbi:putative ATP-dependent helicase IRC20 [Camellia lanceoleosa]|uniref:ATP-dependent helicase IRC20 n=1 Tax=Camellia lanceoleosa TaxID=1840588 RepID=A0ACC0H6E6_9ERIC|nr:putative ATP-dependent helicase IRC20 [Camellia lanceoleosa]
MVSLNEEVKDLNVHVFKWNQKLHNIEESQGLFMFRINNASKKATRIKHGGVGKIYSASLFELEALSTLDSIQYLVSQVIEDKQFHSKNTAINLRKDISAYLLSCFKFDIETLYQNPTIVIVRKERKVIDDDDDKSKGLKRSKLSVEEVEEIRGGLLSDLEEPMSCHECQGLHEIEVAMRVKEFDGDNDEEPVDDCSICLGEICGGMMVAITPCLHMFHRDCLFKWLPKTSRCSFCRSFCATMV